MTKELKNKIKDITECFHRGDEDFVEYAEKLLAKGFTEDETIKLLKDIFHTVANEYGD